MEARGKTKGYVYVIQSECIHLPDGDKCFCPVKIGSAIDWKTRIGNLDGAVPVDFKVHMLIECEDCRGLETVIHKELQDQKVGQNGKKNTEFFRVDVKTAKRVARKCAIEYTRQTGIAKPSIKTKIPQLGRSASSIQNTQRSLFAGDIMFECKVPGGGMAVGCFRQINGKNKFVVRKGSKIRKIPAASFEHSEPQSYYRLWCDICAHRLNENNELREDYVFPSRAAATSVVCASTRNGDKEWYTGVDGGHYLGEYFGKI